MVIERPKRFNMIASEEEQAMLRALANADGITASDWVRMSIRREYVARFGKKKPPTT